MVSDNVTRVSISFSKDVLRKLDKLAKKQSRNRSKQVEFLLKYYLENNKED